MNIGRVEPVTPSYPSGSSTYGNPNTRNSSNNNSSSNNAPTFQEFLDQAMKNKSIS